MIGTDVRRYDRVRITQEANGDSFTVEGTVGEVRPGDRMSLLGYGWISLDGDHVSVEVLKAPMEEPPPGSVVVAANGAVFARPVWDQTEAAWGRLSGPGSHAWYSWAEILAIPGSPRLVDLSVSTTDYSMTQNPADIHQELSGFFDRLVMSTGEREALKAMMVHYGTARYREGWNHRGAGHTPDGGPDR